MERWNGHQCLAARLESWSSPATAVSGAVWLQFRRVAKVCQEPIGTQDQNTTRRSKLKSQVSQYDPFLQFELFQTEYDALFIIDAAHVE